MATQPSPRLPVHPGAPVDRSGGAGCRVFRETLLARTEGVRLATLAALPLDDHLRACDGCRAVAGDARFLRSCLRVAPWLAEHAAGRLTGAAEAAVADHLLVCPLCRAEQRQLAADADTGGDTGAVRSPADAGGTPAVAPPGLHRHVRVAGRRALVGTAACLAVLGGAGATLMRSSHPVSAPQPPALAAPGPLPTVSLTVSTTAPAARTPANPPAGPPAAAPARPSGVPRPVRTAEPLSAGPSAAPATAPAGPQSTAQPAPAPTPAPSPSSSPSPIIPPLPTPPVGGDTRAAAVTSHPR